MESKKDHNKSAHNQFYYLPQQAINNFKKYSVPAMHTSFPKWRQIWKIFGIVHRCCIDDPGVVTMLLLQHKKIMQKELLKAKREKPKRGWKNCISIQISGFLILCFFIPNILLCKRINMMRCWCNIIWFPKRDLWHKMREIKQDLWHSWAQIQLSIHSF